MSETLSRFLMITAGTLYPAYKSYKAVRTKDTKEYVKWMMYWIVFAIYSVLETFLDFLLAFWFPFYFQIKIIFIVWLLSPWTKGASILYRKWVHPTLNTHEKEIDALIESAKSNSYNQMVRIGSQSLVYAKDVVAEAAIRGQQQLVNQLQRSYSANDVSSERENHPKKIEVGKIEEQDESSDLEQQHIPKSPRPRRRSRSRSRTTESLVSTDSQFAQTIPRRTAKNPCIDREITPKFLAKLFKRVL
uniref:Receptor expression-enhancing protein n=1 Tax=Caenorhabditis tropicalis TaxID=1561998 RepID=A0A1I7UJP0_9PELO